MAKIIVFPTGKKKKKKWWSVNADIAYASLQALRESADAFPPLKSTVGAALAIWDTIENVRAAKKTAKNIALQVVEVLEQLADLVPDPHDIPPDILDRIRELERVLKDIQHSMDALSKLGRLHRWQRQNQHKQDLLSSKSRLDETLRNFTVKTGLMTEMRVCKMDSKIDKTQATLSGLVLCHAVLFVGPQVYRINGL